jgi:nitrogen fixation NifU-like protein
MFDLYKDLIIEHGINPRNKYVLTEFNHFSTGFNHLCGDKFDIYICIKNEILVDISFTGIGCSVSTASASLLTLSLKNKSLQHTESLFFYFINVIKDEKAICYDELYYNLNVLASVRKYPARVKCATLIWHTLVEALKNNFKK